VTHPELSVTQARRITLAAQGFTRPRPGAQGLTVSAVHLNRVIERLGFFQIDSVNVLVRAHYMPMFSRMGAYDRELLHRASGAHQRSSAGREPRRLFEYWAHVAALVDVQLWPAMQHRMASGHGMWGGMRRVETEQPDLVERVYAEVAERGPITARQIEVDTERDRSQWGWNWSQAKVALEYLFYVGRITAARRNSQFEREYDLPERVIPGAILERPAFDDEAAHRYLVEHAARALGVGTVQCFNDYFRMAPEPGRRALDALVADGTLEPVRIEGWKRQAYRHRDAVLPRRVQARALLSPFDPLVFERTRTEKLFDFRYRIEIYVPETQRVHGYYVLPFLLGDRIVARVDLKADRTKRQLVVQGAWAESHAPDDTAEQLADELELMARWLDLDSVSPPLKGDLAAGLTSVLARR